MESLIENDEIIQKVDVYKESTSNNEFNKNLAALKQQVLDLETDLGEKITNFGSIKDHEDVQLDTDTED